MRYSISDKVKIICPNMHVESTLTSVIKTSGNVWSIIEISPEYCTVQHSKISSNFGRYSFRYDKIQKIDENIVEK